MIRSASVSPLLAWLLTAAAPIAAQEAAPGVTSTIQGRVLERGSNAPIEDAAVRVEGSTLFSLTDSLGRYRLEEVPPGPQVLRVEHVGYATTRITVRVLPGGALTVDLEVAVQALELEGLVVTADPVSRARGEEGTATVIETEAIRNQVAASLTGVLELSPGQPLTAPGLDEVQQIALRSVPTSGVGGSLSGAGALASFGTVIILDGVPLSNNANLQTTGSRGEISPPTSAGAGIDLRRIPAATLERVEVIRGLPSARWGDLTQGAIVVDTRAGDVDPLLSGRIDARTTEFSVLGGTDLGDRNTGTLVFDVARTLISPQLTNDDAYRLSTQASHRILIGSTGAGGPADARLRLDSRLDFYQLFEDNPEDPEIAPGSSSYGRDTGLRLLERALVTLAPDHALNVTLAVDHTRQRSFVSRSRIRAALPFARTFEEGRHEGHYVGGTYVSEVSLDGNPWLFFSRIESEHGLRALGARHDLRLGAELRREWNHGAGYQFDIEFPPQVTFNGVEGFDRPRAFDDVAALATTAFYVDDRLSASVFDEWLLTVQAGLRLDLLHSDGRWLGGVRDAALQPRLTAALSPRPWITVRGSVGRTAKYPSIGQLAPPPRYFDVVNVNRFSNDPVERLAVLTTSIRDETNPDLGMSTGDKREVGLDVAVGTNALISLVAFDDRVSGGVGRQPEGAFILREIYAVSDTIEGNGIPPELLEPPIAVDTVPILLQRPANNLTMRSRGLELVASLPEIAALRTRFEISGAWIRTELAKDGLDTGARFSNFQMDPRIERIPYWDAVTEAGERALLTGRLIHHRPDVGLVITLTGQALLSQSQEDLASADTLSFAGYLRRDGTAVPVPEEDRGDPEYEDLRVRRVGLAPLLTSPDTWFLSLQVSKSMPLDGRLSFFAFNALDRRGGLPSEADQLPAPIPPMRFGLEITLPGRSLARLFR